MSHKWSDELAALRTLVLEAGDLLLANLGAAGRADAKSGTEFVTVMDRRSEELLIEGLAREFPGDAILAEESGDHAGASGRIWYVDPLDGTTNYAHGYPFFCVSAACADADGLAFGIVHAPYLDETYLAVRSGGARLERQRAGETRDLAPRGSGTLDQALLATGFPYVRDELVARNTALVRAFLEAPCQGLRRAGSAALDLVHVAAGTLDGYWEFRLNPWDTAAGTLVAREAGVRVSGCDGSSADLHWQDILAAAPGVHQQMLDIIADTPGGTS